jgi:hypothetical protein
MGQIGFPETSVTNYQSTQQSENLHVYFKLSCY